MSMALGGGGGGGYISEEVGDLSRCYILKVRVKVRVLLFLRP
jgi:hypothetical protein